MPSRSARHTAARKTRRPARSSGRAAIEPVEGRILMSLSVGDADPSWNNGTGRLSLVPNGGVGTADTTLVAPQIDEKVVLAGVFTPSAGAAKITEVVRLTPQGAFDSTFNSGSRVALSFTASALLVQTDDKIVVAGPELERLNNDGTIDTAFGTNGVVSLPFSSSNLTEQADGKLLVAGTTSAGVPEVVRYNANGSVDTAYGSNGTVSLAVGGAVTFTTGGIDIQPSTDEAYVALAATGDPSLASFAMVKLTTSGTFDGSFGSGGLAEIAGYGGGTTSVGGVSVSPEGTVYNVGNYEGGTDTGLGYALAYSADGTHAAISGQTGVDTFADTVAVGADNKPVVIGTIIQGTGSAKQTTISAVRFAPVDFTTNSTFTYDTSFGAAGSGMVNVPYNNPSSLDSATVGDLGYSGYEMANGNIVLGGVSANPGSATTTYNVTRLVNDTGLYTDESTISGSTYFDENFDGTRQSGDIGLPNFPVVLENNQGTVLFTVYTDAAGHYSFNGLTPGTYEVLQTVGAGYTHTAPGTAAAATFSSVTVAANADALNDFGLTGTDSITGTFFLDANGNGVKDGSEAGISGGTVFIDINHDTALTSADVAVTTNSSGTFTFTHLTPNSYYIRAVVSSGHNLTTPTTFPLIFTLTASQQATGLLIGET